MIRNLIFINDFDILEQFNHHLVILFEYINKIADFFEQANAYINKIIINVMTELIFLIFKKLLIQMELLFVNESKIQFSIH